MLRAAKRRSPTRSSPQYGNNSGSVSGCALASSEALANRLLRMPPRRSKETEPPEPDRLEGYAHPRENLRLVGHDNLLARVAQAIRSGRPPQAWLITGPPGIGKAT